MLEPNEKQVALRIPSAMWESLGKWAERQQRTRAAMARIFLEVGMETMEERGLQFPESRRQSRQHKARR